MLSGSYCLSCSAQCKRYIYCTWVSSILVLVLQTQYILIKACHSRSNEYIYCNVSIFRRWIWLRNCLCHRGPDNISLKISFFPGKSSLCRSPSSHLGRACLKDCRMMFIATYRQEKSLKTSLKTFSPEKLMYMHKIGLFFQLFFCPRLFIGTVSKVFYWLYLERLRNSSPQSCFCWHMRGLWSNKQWIVQYTQ